VSIELQQLVASLAYKPGWSFRVVSGNTFSMGAVATEPAGNVSTGTVAASYAWPEGWAATLVIEIRTPDSGDPSRTILVSHHFSVPSASFCGSWRRWLLEQILAVERHEACEFFQIGEGRPFYPEHGPDVDLYAVRERSETP
jgi:hypothetical protein